jgi:eukaryotic-like serine/threonine-protein kinase
VSSEHQDLPDTELPPQPAPSLPAEGDLLGVFRLVRVLQSGGMGVVYLAERADGSFEQKVAIKLVLPTHLQGDPLLAQQLLMRFEDERRLLARIQHPNVARIIDGGRTSAGQPWLAMEYVENGRSLTEFCRSQALDVRETVALFTQVCEGVQAAHAHLVVHRDLKPDNVLVGGDGQPRLLDFGIAKLLQADALASPREATEFTAMTPAYASPEQIRREGVSVRSDVYSLGVLLYQLLSGVRPYELGGLRAAEVEHVVCETLPPPMRQALDRAVMEAPQRKQRRTQIGPELERIVARAMHKDPQRRYGSAQALADDLRRYLAGEPVQAHPDGASYRIRKFLGRHRVASAIAAIALLAVLGSAGVAVSQAHEARQAARDASDLNDFLIGVLAASDPYQSGRELSLAEAVDRSAADIDRRFAQRPALAAKLRHALGYSLISRHRLEQAEPLLERGLADAEASLPALHPTRIGLRESMAQLRLSQGRHSEGVALLEGLRADLAAAGPELAAYKRIVLNNLGVALLKQGEYGRARPLLLEAQAAAPAASALDEAALLANLAQSAHGLEDPAAAERLYLQAEAVLRQNFPQGHPDLAVATSNRAELLFERGDTEAGFALLRESLAQREAVFGEAHPAIEIALLNLASQLAASDKTQEARQQLERAIELGPRIDPQGSSNQLRALLLLSRVLRSQGEFQAAWDRYSQARTMAAALPETPPDLMELLPLFEANLCNEAGTRVPECRR